MKIVYLFATGGLAVIAAIVAFATAIAPPPEPEIEPKELVITEVELSSKNGTQWIEIYNPQNETVSVHATVTDQRQTFGFYNDYPTRFPPHEYVTIIISGDPQFPNSNVSLSFPNPGTIVEETPELTDTFNDSRTWQRNGTEWIFAEETPARATTETRFSSGDIHSYPQEHYCEDDDVIC